MRDASEGAALLLRVGVTAGLALLLAGVAVGKGLGDPIKEVGLAVLVSTPMAVLCWIVVASVGSRRKISLLGILTLVLILIAEAASRI